MTIPYLDLLTSLEVNFDKSTTQYLITETAQSAPPSENGKVIR